MLRTSNMLQATGHKVPCRSASRPVCPTRRLAVGPKAFRESGPEQPKTPVRSVFIVDIDNPKRCKVDYDNQEDYAAWLTRMGTGGLESEDGSVAYLKLEELEDGKTYYIGSAVGEDDVREITSRLMHLYQARKDELARAIVLENPGSRSAPELLAVEGPYIKAVPSLLKADVVVLGAETIYIVLYELYVESDSYVYKISKIAKEVKDQMEAGGASYAVFTNKKVIPVFMTEAYKDERVNAKVQKTCEQRGVMRFARSGRAISRVC